MNIVTVETNETTTANDNTRIRSHDALLKLRDMAASLVGDPLHADTIARQAWKSFRARKEKREGSEAQWWLEQEVLSLCLAATDCPRCAEQEDPDWEPADTERELDDAESSDDEEDDEDDLLADSVA
jgi:hypothetical protein